MKPNSPLYAFFCAGLAGGALIFGLLGPPQACAKSIKKDEVNIRAEPSTSSDILYKAPLGYPIIIEKESKGWVYFRDWENNRGWVHKPLVSDIQTAVVKTDKANIRSAPNDKAKVVTKAEIGEIYKILASKGQWVHLGYYHGGASVGWIHADLIFGQ